MRMQTRINKDHGDDGLDGGVCVHRADGQRYGQ